MPVQDLAARFVSLHLTLPHVKHLLARSVPSPSTPLTAHAAFLSESLEFQTAQYTGWVLLYFFKTFFGRMCFFLVIGHKGGGFMSHLYVYQFLNYKYQVKKALSWPARGLTHLELVGA